MANNVNKEYAPIVVFAYNRVDEFISLIQSIKLNQECLNSDLYIFIDGIKNKNDYYVNEKIFLYSQQIFGFNSVNIERSKINKGLSNSIIDGVSKIIELYGKVIVFEDDLVVSNTALKYLNKSLNYYEDDENVFSIAAYSPNINIRSNDVFFYPRIESWGWATWKDRWNKVDWDVRDYVLLKNNKKLIKSFNKGGNDLFNMLKAQQEGCIDSWAIRFCYAAFKNNMLTVYPPKSFVKNVGCNSTGTNFKEYTNKYDVILSNNYCPNIIKYNNKCKNYIKMYNFYSNYRFIDVYNKFVRKMKKIMVKTND